MTRSDATPFLGPLCTQLGPKIQKASSFADLLQALVIIALVSGSMLNLTGGEKNPLRVMGIRVGIPSERPISRVQIFNTREFNCHTMFTNCLFPTDWVRDVTWAPNTAMPYNMVASCSEDRCVLIWKQMEAEGPWVPSLMHTFDAPVWRLSWSVTGNVLAVSTSDHKVTLWKQSLDESWIQISTVDE